MSDTRGDERLPLADVVHDGHDGSEPACPSCRPPARTADGWRVATFEDFEKFVEDVSVALIARADLANHPILAWTNEDDGPWESLPAATQATGVVPLSDIAPSEQSPAVRRLLALRDEITERCWRARHATMFNNHSLRPEPVRCVRCTGTIQGLEAGIAALTDNFDRIGCACGPQRSCALHSDAGTTANERCER